MKNNIYHIVKERNIPIISSSFLNLITISLPKIIKTSNIKPIFLILLIAKLLIINWSIKIKKENTLEGKHSKLNNIILKKRFVLFISSEVLLFVSIFWIYLNNSLSPNIEIGNIWPPNQIQISNPILIPIYGSLLLIYSRVLITKSHHSLYKKKKRKTEKNLIKCILIGILFIDIQISEYSYPNIISFSIRESNYRNRFFTITIVHGTHVLVGVIMLSLSLKFIKNNSIRSKNNSRIEISAWYWHFVDLVWLFVFTLIYWINFFF